MPKILNYDIIGCYAQTELGHGSNVRGLETTAKWDPVKKEFEIHSPTLTASKWWNGSMGRTATHAVSVRAYPSFLYDVPERYGYLQRERDGERQSPWLTRAMCRLLWRNCCCRNYAPRLTRAKNPTRTAATLITSLTARKLSSCKFRIKRRTRLCPE